MVENFEIAQNRIKTLKMDRSHKNTSGHILFSRKIAVFDRKKFTFLVHSVGIEPAPAVPRSKNFQPFLGGRENFFFVRERPVHH